MPTQNINHIASIQKDNLRVCAKNGVTINV